jgi:SAM-dependent methyltransferase
VTDELDFLLPHLQSGTSLVDCGCGGGGLTLQLSETVAPGFVCGFDQSPGAIEEARQLALSRGNKSVQFSIASVYDSGLAPGTFDVALFCGVLGHLDNPLRALQHAHRLLKPGGLVAAREPEKHGDWCGGSDYEAVYQVNQMLIDDFKAVGADPFIGSRLKALLREAGFVEVDASPSYSPALSSVEMIGEGFGRRLQETDFIEKVVARGKHSAEDLKTLAQRVARWRADPASIVGMSDCSALARKPK